MLRDDDLTDRTADLVLVVEVRVERLVRHDASARFAQQMSKFRHMGDDIRNLLRSRPLHCQRRDQVGVQSAVAAALSTCLSLRRASCVDSPRGRRRGT